MSSRVRGEEKPTLKASLPRWNGCSLAARAATETAGATASPRPRSRGGRPGSRAQGCRKISTALNDGCPTLSLEGRAPQGPDSSLGQHTLAHGIEAHEVTICVGNEELTISAASPWAEAVGGDGLAESCPGSPASKGRRAAHRLDDGVQAIKRSVDVTIIPRLAKLEYSLYLHYYMV